jgi:ribosomal protein L25 (general stress protein Ctc)
MKISFELDAEFREDQGKGASRRLRHLGKVPAILYGGKRDARALLVNHTKLAQLMDDERFYSTILALKVGSQQQAAVLKDVQRHPFKNQIMHIDFQRVLEDEKIKNKVSAAREHLSGFLLNSAPFLEVHDREGSLERIRGVLSANGQEIGRSTYTPHVTIGLYAGSFPNGIVSSKIAAFPKETCMFTVDRITFARYRAQETAGALTYQHDVSLRTM